MYCFIIDEINVDLEIILYKGNKCELFFVKKVVFILKIYFEYFIMLGILVYILQKYIIVLVKFEVCWNCE